MAVRSNYIKNLMDTKNSLEKRYQEVIAESMQNIIGDNTKEEVRKLLREAEDEDSYDVEDVDTDTLDKEDGKDVSVETEVDDAEEKAEDAEEEAEDIEDELDDEEDEDIWKDLENYKSADGEYDCRGMEDGKLRQVLKAMGPEDGIRVMSNDDGSVSVEVDGDMIDGVQEFIIDLDDLEGDAIEEGKVNLGYTSKYQEDTAMTTPDNHEPSKDTYSMDGGVPTGTERPYGNGPKNGDPYMNESDEMCEEEPILEIEMGEDVDECGIGECDIEESGLRMGNCRYNREPNGEDNGHARAKRHRNRTGVNPTMNSQNESIEFKKKMNKIYEENKQMKSIIPLLQNKIMESMVINSSMGYIVRLLNENATSVDEKKQISERFSKVNTLEEGKKLYETISAELQQVGKKADINNVFNGQLSEAKKTKQNLVETTMYKSEKVNATLDFMKRLDSVK